MAHCYVLNPDLSGGEMSSTILQDEWGDPVAKEFGTIWGVTYIQFTGTALLLFTAFDPWKTLK